MPKVSKYVQTLNKAQQQALKQVFDRAPIYAPVAPGHERPITYRQFRRTVRYNFLLDCAMVPWCGMWLGIEPDGHTHS